MLTVLEFRFIRVCFKFYAKWRISPHEWVHEGLQVVDSKWRKSLLIFLCINHVLQFSFLLYKYLKMKSTDYEWKMVYCLLLVHWTASLSTIHSIWILRLEYVQLVNQTLSWNEKFGMNSYFFKWSFLKLLKKFQVDSSLGTSLLVINFGRKFPSGLLWIQRWRLWDWLFLC